MVATREELIMAATGCSVDEVEEIEEIMRDVIFHSTLDWQTREEHDHAAQTAYAVRHEMNRNQNPLPAPPGRSSRRTARRVQVEFRITRALYNAVGSRIWSIQDAVPGLAGARLEWVPGVGCYLALFGSRRAVSRARGGQASTRKKSVEQWYLGVGDKDGQAGHRVPRRHFNRVTCLSCGLSGIALMSVSQRRTTRHPCAFSAAVCCKSRWMFRAIFATQYAALCRFFSWRLSRGQSRPCQKSPSQNTTTRARQKTRSGFPGRPCAFFLYRTPSLQTSERSNNSGIVSVLQLHHSPGASFRCRPETNEAWVG